MIRDDYDPLQRARWSADDEDYLRAWGSMGARNMANDLGRSDAAIRARASKLKVSLKLWGRGA